MHIFTCTNNCWNLLSKSERKNHHFLRERVYFANLSSSFRLKTDLQTHLPLSMYRIAFELITTRLNTHASILSGMRTQPKKKWKLKEKTIDRISKCVRSLAVALNSNAMFRRKDKFVQRREEKKKLDNNAKCSRNIGGGCSLVSCVIFSLLGCGAICVLSVCEDSHRNHLWNANVYKYMNIWTAATLEKIE